jgi:pyridoxal phosphate enzyme (YggS family)
MLAAEAPFMNESNENPTLSNPASPRPDSETGVPTHDWKSLFALAAVIGFSMLLRSGIAQMPLERDEGEYAYIADRWLAGDIPYRDAFDQKTPGVFAAYAALFALGFRSAAAIHWLGHASLVGTVVFLYLIGRRWFSHQVGWMSGLFAIVLIMDVNVLGSASNTEVFAVLPLTACVYFAMRAVENGGVGNAILSGVCGGLGLSCKQTTLPIVVFAVAWIVFQRWRRPASSESTEAAERGLANATNAPSGSSPFALAISFAVGIAIVFGPMCAYFAMKGAWSAFFDCVAGHNLAYAARIPLRYYGATFWDSSRFLYVVFAPLFGAAVAAFFFTRTQGVRSLNVCWWWLLASFLAVSVGGYYRKHYFILLMPSFAVIAAYGIQSLAVLLEPNRLRGQRWIAVVLSIVAIGWTLYIHWGYYRPQSLQIVCRQIYGFNPFPESPSLGKLIRENSDPDDRVFICGSEPQILFFAQRASASRYIFAYPLFATADSIARQKEVMEELKRNPPKFVLLVDPSVVPTSYSLSSDSPQFLFEALADFLTEYTPIAASTLGTDGTTRMIRPTYNESGVLEFVHATGEYLTIRIYRRGTQNGSPAKPARSENGMNPVRTRLKENLTRVRERIENAAHRSGRHPSDVQMVAVTKSVDVNIACELLQLGATDLGENRPQELWRKQEQLAGSVRWHLVGTLQKNKARRTLPLVHLIHSADSLPLLHRIDELGAELNVQPRVLLEVKLSEEAAKHGFQPDEVPRVIESSSQLACTRICGLMTMAPNDANADSARQCFASLRDLRDRITGQAHARCDLKELSMGMSSDFEVAILEGATMVRIGSALFDGVGVVS